ncbi:hypothetical protein ABK985_23125 [Vibrio parahaemolyticus]|uniref:hypothetical protein n=1 Tax=Vibrio TaxID=662 RepID=UPI00296454E2|nr:hypothetical protein [Vibrio sp. Vb2911]MCF9832356.1 hypothetical protein [Vibrio parahaemolyticus]MDF4372459.1 hypothetical protein [Vibrio parahaemolyticus]MDF4386566.1 hypothetical protein [Vibrio parahaemolyticus]MDW1598470.1 hypothetical protein [Vibrio sp. Vb2911]
MAKSKLKKVETKVSLNIKIDRKIDERLKRARAVARDQGEIFNVSAHTETFLLKLLKDIEKELGITEKTGTNEDQLSLDVDAEK